MTTELAKAAGVSPPEIRFDELTDDELTADFRVYQRRRGHRYSIDDVTTAFEAVHACPNPRSILDLGAGIGSVALMLAWRNPDTRVLGIEAQGVSHALARWNVVRNGVGSRVTILRGDLRDLDMFPPEETYELITGTPPYFPRASATASPDPQRAFARIEYRGGIEAYLRTAYNLMSPDGRVVVCVPVSAVDRCMAAAAKLGFWSPRGVIVSPREGRPPLFSVWTFRASGVEHEPEVVRWDARDRTGHRTADHRRIRRAFGLFQFESES